MSVDHVSDALPIDEIPVSFYSYDESEVVFSKLAQKINPMLPINYGYKFGIIDMTLSSSLYSYLWKGPMVNQVTALVSLPWVVIIDLFLDITTLALRTVGYVGCCILGGYQATCRASDANRIYYLQKNLDKTKWEYESKLKKYLQQEVSLSQLQLAENNLGKSYVLLHTHNPISYFQEVENLGKEVKRLQMYLIPYCHPLEQRKFVQCLIQLKTVIRQHLMDHQDQRLQKQILGNLENSNVIMEFYSFLAQLVDEAIPAHDILRYLADPLKKEVLSEFINNAYHKHYHKLESTLYAWPIDPSISGELGSLLPLLVDRLNPIYGLDQVRFKISSLQTKIKRLKSDQKTLMYERPQESGNGYSSRVNSPNRHQGSQLRMLDLERKERSLIREERKLVDLYNQNLGLAQGNAQIILAFLQNTVEVGQQQA